MLARIGSLLAQYPAELPRTTFDNGTAFALHDRLDDELRTFFGDPRAPWQKGGK